jgi:acyl-CoA reductase-like NAD-dependent aldehyde dehydrogenase
MVPTVENDQRSCNPATGAEIGRVRGTPANEVVDVVERARKAQVDWAGANWADRRRVLARWWRILSRDAEDWADLIRDEIGKPRTEAMAGDVISTLDGLRSTISRAGRWLRDERIGPGWQRWLLMPAARLRWAPLGVVGMLGTWNYPLFLNAPPIGQALAAGNAVVWKPSELASQCGQRLQESLEEAGIPAGLVSTVQGQGEVGRALVAADVDKVMFTGGIRNGRLVLAALGARGIPALAELSGFDVAIVLPDAPLESTVRALTWGAFVGCGQTCVAVKRVYVIGDARPWVEAFAAHARALQVGDPARLGTDVGPMISEAARDHFHRMIQAAVGAGARVVAGGEKLPGPGWFYAPTVLETTEPDAENELAGAFGPVVMLRGFLDLDAAVASANLGEFALGASVWSRRRGLARDVAWRLHAGMVCVNEAVTPTAHAFAPFGGRKGSGYGRTHGRLGLLEFTAPQVLYERNAGGFRPQLFPYSKSQLTEQFLSLYRRLFHAPR